MVSAIIIIAVLFSILCKGTVSVLVSLLAWKVLEAGTRIYSSPEVPDWAWDLGRFWRGSRPKGAECKLGMPYAKYLQDFLAVWTLCTLNSVSSRERLS